MKQHKPLGGLLAAVLLASSMGCGAGTPTTSTSTHTASTSTPAPTPTTPTPVSPTYDVDRLGVPKCVNTHYSDLSQISQISEFRSSVGHDYLDSVEGCRSMKHYFMFPGTSTRLYAPVSDIVAIPAVSGDKIVIQADAQPAFWFMIFHPILTTPFAVGERVTEGQVLGTHESSNTNSDIAV